MHRIKVLIPGPWWNYLSYETDEAAVRGARVLVPVGRGTRVGLSLGPEESPPPAAKLKKVLRVIDQFPVLSETYLRAAHITSHAFLCSAAEVLHTLLPSSFWKGVSFPEYTENRSAASSPPSFLYRYRDAERWDSYRSQILGCPSGVLCLFPERCQAKAFHAALTGLVPKKRLILWPASGAEAALKCWKQALEQDNAVVIGAPGAACAPLGSPGLIIIDDESNPSWRAKSYPFFSVRSFAASRARISGTKLLLGGRLPSSRIFKNFLPPAEKKRPEERRQLRFINLYDVPRVSFKGMQWPLPLADSLLAETADHVASGEAVFWLLDRRGVTGEVQCADCGHPIQCSQCGTPMVFEAGMLRCPLCGRKAGLPEQCPVCGGKILQGASPGLEALLPMAQTLLGDRPVWLWHLDNPKTQTEAKKRLGELAKYGGLVLGSRRALSLLDTLHPRLICWLDADSEARQAHYASRFNAFSMLLESCWRGEGERQVVMQTRSPGKRWQRGLQGGWELFWRSELPERQSLGFPPESNLVEITIPPEWRDKDELAIKLDDAGFSSMEPDRRGSKLVVFAPKMAPLRRVLAEYFMIQRSRTGFPRIQVWTE